MIASIIEHLDVVGRSPSGVDDLRLLILRLAVRGQLVQQDRADETAHDLVRRIAGKPSPASGVGDYELPATWAWAAMGDLAPGRLGKMLDAAKNRGPLRRYIRNTNVQWFWFNLADVAEMRVEDRELAEYTVRAGDLVVCEGGEPGRAAVCDDVVDGMVFQKALHRLRPRAGVSARYLAYVLRHEAVSGRLARAFTGATIKHLTGRSLAAYAVPVPPAREQERIVERLDELMLLCDLYATRLRHRKVTSDVLRRSCMDRLATGSPSGGHHWTLDAARWRTLVDDSKGPVDVKELIMALAVRGRLVPQDPGDEPAVRLLERIRSSLANARSREVDPIVSVPFELPESWRWSRLGSILSYCRNGLFTTTSDTGEGYPILRISAGTSRADMVTDLSDVKFASVPADRAVQYMLESGDLLACRFNGNLHFVGRVSQVPHVASPVLHPDKLIRMKASEVSHEFLRLALNSRPVREQIEAVASTTAGNIGINGAQLRSLLVPIPPLAEQSRIVERARELLWHCEQLGERIAGRSVAAGRYTSAVAAL